MSFWCEMELVCEKYREKMEQEKAACRHPSEYCKFRSSCIIHFLSKAAGAAQKSAESTNNAQEKTE